MAETLLSFGVEKLWDFLVRESERLNRVDKQLTGLKHKINFLRSFLEDADAKKHANAMVNNCVEEIKEIVLDAEDVIETFLLKEELGRTSGIRKHMRRHALSIVVRRKLALDMAGISQRISKVIKDMQDFGVKEMKVDGIRQERQREMRRTYPSNNESNFVGLETNVKKLVDYLVEEDCIQVVSICGMGGIGKTTLAQQVFKHEMVKNHFDGVVWVCISQQFTRKYVWQTILEKLSSKHDEHRDSDMNRMSEEELHEKLFRLLKTRKSLIVLDDMWKEEDWDIMKPAFPPTKGWKILLTSRNERVALHVDQTCFIHKPKCLTREESWTLFRMIATKNETEFKVDDEMEEICKQIFKYCGGLPLAIKVLGGFLVVERTLDEWKRIYKNIRSYLADRNIVGEENHYSVQHVLSLSYEELPISLKHCFLYLAHFPEDYPIDMEKLYYYWAAEGILKKENYERGNIQDVADMYMENLVKRNMVMSERDAISSRFKTCRLHDMMREVCLLKAKEENFLRILPSSTTNSESLYRSRRLVVQQDPDVMKVERKYSKLRSLMYIMEETWMDSSLCFTQLQLMRVLDISYVKFKGGKLPSIIGNLIHLRYLSLFEAEVVKLPSSMRNLKKLLYLNLDLFALPIYVPDILKEMQELRYLSLPSSWRMHDKTNLELGNLINLETLWNFSTKHSSVGDLRGMTRLRTISINFNVEGCTKETLLSSLSELGHLEYLKINSSAWVNASKNVETEFVLDCVHLKHLDLDIYMPRLLDEQNLSSHLTTICLRNCRLKEDPMPTLEKLLHLKEVFLWNESFCGMRMVCSGGGFPQLQKLLFCDLEEWEEWIVEEGSMPFLHTLKLMDCEKLKDLPDGIRFITSLKKLTIQYTGEGWKKERFLEGGEDYYKVQHIPTVKIWVN